MSRSIYEPNLYRASAKNAHGVRSLQQKPSAMRWWEPDCFSATCVGDEPFLDNGFAQPGGDLEVFAFRLNADGLIQTKGFLDASGAENGTVAWTMPGVNPGETDFIPSTAGNDAFSLKVTTTGDETGITQASAYIDATTGDVTVSWGGGCCPAWMSVFDNLPYGQEISSADGTVNLEYPFCDWSDNAAGIFDYVRSNSVHIGADNNYNVQLLVDGIYTFSWMEVVEDLNGSNWGIHFFLDPGMRMVGRAANEISDQLIQVLDFQDAGGTGRSFTQNFYYQRSITLPCQRFFGNAGTVYPYLIVLPTSTGPTISCTFRNRLWVTYHGPLAHAQTFAGDHTYYDPYSEPGGPIRPPDHTV